MSKPTYKRADRVADQIRMEVAEILAKKVKDPRLDFVTVTDVAVSGDLRLAKVYVTTFCEGREAQAVMKGLSRAVGFIRTELGRRMALRYTPELIFLPDASGARAERIEHILDHLPHSHDDSGTSETEPAAS